MLICYSLVGAIVYVTLLLLGEMATQYPVAGMYLRKQLLHSTFAGPTVCCHLCSSGGFRPALVPPCCSVSPSVFFTSHKR
jgi:hypothetical protein